MGKQPEEQKDFINEVLKMEKKLFLKNYHKVFTLLPGPCPSCSECSFPEGCDFPGKSRPCACSFGIDWFATLGKLGIEMSILDEPKEFTTYAIILLE